MKPRYGEAIAFRKGSVGTAIKPSNALVSRRAWPRTHPWPGECGRESPRWGSNATARSGLVALVAMELIRGRKIMPSGGKLGRFATDMQVFIDPMKTVLPGVFPS